MKVFFWNLSSDRVNQNEIRLCSTIFQSIASGYTPHMSMKKNAGKIVVTFDVLLDLESLKTIITHPILKQKTKNHTGWLLMTLTFGHIHSYLGTLQSASKDTHRIDRVKILN